MFQSGPEPEDVIACQRLDDGRTLAVFKKDGDQAELVITEDANQPEIWRRLDVDDRAAVMMRFQNFQPKPSA